MLEIINNLRPFFEDCYRRINVREYAKIMKISPPTASKLLFYYYSEKLLKKETYKNYILFFADKESQDFIGLSRIYWRDKLSDLILYMEKNITDPAIVLFGSLSKAEAKQDSDIDLAVFAVKKDLELKTFENKLKRKIQLFWFDSLKSMKNRELYNNIINGYTLIGSLS